MLVAGGVAGGAGAGWAATRPRSPETVGRPTFDVRHFGAAGDGRTKDTRAIQGAIDAAASLDGAVVRLPAGRWLSGTLQLRSDVTIELAAGSILLASDDDDDFATHERLPFATESDDETMDFAHALLAARDAENVVIAGAGTIDMNRRRRGGPKPIAFKRCRLVTVRGITIVHAPNYCVSLGGCDDVIVEGVVIRNAYADGIDPDCCRRVRIANCDIESDDDAVCLKASLLLGVPGATEDVVVTGCRMRSASNCFKLGTESTGDFRRIVVSSCTFDGRPADDHDGSAAAEGGGIAILSVDGGAIDGVSVSDVVMHDVVAPIFVRLGNRGRDQDRRSPGVLRNVEIRDVVARGARGTGSIAGLPGHPVEGITLERVRIDHLPSTEEASGLDVPERPARYPRVSMYGNLPAFGLYVRHARDVRLRDVELTVDAIDARPALVADDVGGLHVDGIARWPSTGDAPSLWLNDVRDGVIESDVVPEGRGVLLRVTGEATKHVAVVGGGFWTHGRMELAPELGPVAVVATADPSWGIARR
jgi:polygalacturonase